MSDSPSPSDAMQKILSSFKTFEKKLDRLQDNVVYHGNTLAQLRAMILNIAGDAGRISDVKAERISSSKKSAAIQYDGKASANRKGRRNVIKTLPHHKIFEKDKRPKLMNAGDEIGVIEAPGDKLLVEKQTVKRTKKLGEEARKLRMPVNQKDSLKRTKSEKKKDEVKL